jgi:dipeptidyl aminopeptidase/acylaminoacyl peptidase
MINAYVTHPANKKHQSAPLIVLPHGGPEVRDIYGFDPMVQFLTSRGYRVFQPNFRGSAGYGKAFAQAGYGQWGGLMQDDITDGVNHLIKTGKAKHGNICIAGVSYGGYAALMGAVKTSELYQCAVSINGIADLKAMIDYDKDLYGKDSDVYAYVKKLMGDPKRDADRIKATSPLTHAANINTPLLLIHGAKDKVVPVKQSQALSTALKANGKAVKYVELEGVNHSLNGYSDAMYGLNSTVSADYNYGYKKALTEMESFFAQHLK